MAESLVAKALYQGVPATTNVVLFTVPANRTYTISTIVLANTTGTAATVTLGRNGTAATAANQFVPGVSVAANTVEIVKGPFVFEATDTLTALQGTSGAVTVYVSGADHTLT